MIMFFFFKQKTAYEIRAPVLIVKILHVAPHNLERIRVRNAQISADALLTNSENILNTHRFRREALGWDAEHEIWVWTDAEPERTLARTRHTGEIAAFAQQVG